VDPVLLTVPLVLLAGVVSFASPCFLPVVPVFVGYMTGQAAAPAPSHDSALAPAPSHGHAARPAPPRDPALAPPPSRGPALARLGVLHAVVFMVSFGAVFAALWALVGVVGWAVADHRATLRVIGGAILVVLGLQTAGLIRLGFLDRVLKPAYSPDGSKAPTWRRSVLLGLAFGAGWTPCVGPVLGGVLGLTTSTASVWSGLGLLGVYTLGLGLPFVLVCGGATGLAGRLTWFVRHQRGVDRVTGALLIGVGFLVISDLFSRLSAIAAFGL
jgi:cytochrome c-type biogenesis protein